MSSNADPAEAPGEPSVSEGRRLFELITSQASWIHRRVDRTDLSADGETRRLRSFDVTLPSRLAIVRDGGVVVPLTLLTKRPLLRLDTFGADGGPLPVLGRHDNGLLVQDMLVDALGQLVEGELSNAVRKAIRATVMEGDPDQMDMRVSHLEAVVRAQPLTHEVQVQAVLALASDLAQQFLCAVLVPLSSVDVRIVVKVGATEDVSGGFPDWAVTREGRSMDLPLSLTDSAASAHFELRAPLGLRVASVSLLDSRDEPVSLPGPSVTSGGTAHLTGLEKGDRLVDTRIRARVELEPVADGLLRQTALATVFVALLLGVGAWQADRLVDALTANRGGSVAAAALAVPALFLSVQSRRPEHSWVARALFLPRLLNIVTATVLYCLAVYLVTVQPDDPAIEVVMWSCFVIQLGLGLMAGSLLRRVSAEPSTVTTFEYPDDGGSI